jgi:hypothetical protein
MSLSTPRAALADLPTAPLANTRPRPSLGWTLWIGGIVGGSPAATFSAPEDREGAIPMPAGSPWECRFGKPSAFHDDGMLPVADESGRNTGLYRRDDTWRVYRSIECSSDRWKTWVSDAGAYIFFERRLEGKPSQAGVGLNHAKDGARVLVSVVLKPCSSEDRHPDCRRLSSLPIVPLTSAGAADSK